MRYHNWYAKLLRLYPKAFRERFGESMVQTFRDLDRERQQEGRRLVGFLLFVLVETAGGIARENISVMITQNRAVSRAAAGTVLVLTVPLILTLLNPNARLHGGEGGGWDWMPGSFLVMGAMLFCAGIALQFAARRMSRQWHRIAVLSAIVLTFLLLWVELAVDGVSQALFHLA